jgi:hypothetical protein
MIPNFSSSRLLARTLFLVGISFLAGLSCFPAAQVASAQGSGATPPTGNLTLQVTPATSLRGFVETPGGYDVSGSFLTFTSVELSATLSGGNQGSVRSFGVSDVGNQTEIPPGMVEGAGVNNNGNLILYSNGSSSGPQELAIGFILGGSNDLTVRYFADVAPSIDPSQMTTLTVTYTLTAP